MKLLPIPGAPCYRIDCENQVAYSFRGFLKKLNDRTNYKVVNLTIDGKKVVTTIYRMMYCALNNIDITKLPKGVCIAMRNGVVTAVSRSEAANKRFITIRNRRKNMDLWRRNTELINQYYEGNTGPLLEELQSTEKAVKWWFVKTYGLSEERAGIVAAYGVNKYLERLADGFPNPYIMGCIIKYGRGENSRLSKQSEFIDNMKVIEL